MKHVNVMFKPASSACNCVCKYCFYDDVSDCREVKSYGLMSEEIRDKIIRDVFQLPSIESVHFAFQGGEPGLRGLAFYEGFVKTVNRYKKGAQVTYGFQTNGTLLNDEWAKFFKSNDFLVGISIDGFKENHDRHRFLSKNGSYDAVMKGFSVLQEYDVEHNVLTVLTKNLAQYPDQLFDFYLEHDIENVQLIECLPDFGQTVEESPFALRPQDYQFFYEIFFERWLEQLKKGRYIRVGLFDDCIRLSHMHMPTTCGRYGPCQVQVIVEANGNMYPCDFNVLDENLIGNLYEDSFQEIFSFENYQGFLYDRGKISSHCQNCPFYNKVCHGGCKRMRETFVSEEFCAYQEILSLFILNREMITHHLKKIQVL